MIRRAKRSISAHYNLHAVPTLQELILPRFKAIMRLRVIFRRAMRNREPGVNSATVYVASTSGVVNAYDSATGNPI